MTLSPAGWLDSWAEDSLVLASGRLLTTLGYTVFTRSNVIWMHNLSGIEVTSGCDGLTAIGLFISFLVAYPGDMMRRLLMLLSGSVLIATGNIMRICVLTLGQLYWPSGFNFLHLFLTEILFDGLVLALCVFWVNWGSGRGRSEETANPSGALG